MSDFRKLFFAFAVVALLLSSVASAQTPPPIVCSTSAQPLTVRTEGLTEMTGDVIINCTGGGFTSNPTVVGTPLPQVNISVTLSTNITSRLLVDSGPQQITEALLFIDDPQPGAQFPCAPTASVTVCQPMSAGAGGTAVDSGGLVRNVFQGVRQNDNTIAFLAVPINAPGTANRVIRIKNIRAAVAGSSAPNGQIFAFVSIQNPPSNLQLNNSSVNVAFVQQGLAFSLRSATGGSFDAAAAGIYLYQCETFNRDLANAPTGRYSGGGLPGGRSFSLRYREAYAASWKVRDINDPLVEATGNLQQNVPQNNSGAPSAVSRTPESGFYNTGFTATNQLNRAGRADHGTRLRAAFSNVPANVRIYVSVGPAAAVATLGIASAQRSGGGETSATASAYGVVTNSSGGNAGFGTVIANPLTDAEVGLGGNTARYPASAVQGLVEVPIAAGSGAFAWEVFNEDPNNIETLSFTVSFAFRPANNPGLGTVNVNASFAPVSTNNKMSLSQAVTFQTLGGDIPRFSDTSTATASASLNICQTNLLFPFVLNTAGFDTGVAISNTSSDPYGTATQAGNCTLYYYGSSSGGGAAPAPQTTTSAVAAGSQVLFSLSTGGTNGVQATPGFQGYMIAVCNFRYAHGFAFISDVGAQKLSHGYLALILDNGGRTGLTGEGLAQ